MHSYHRSLTHFLRPFYQLAHAFEFVRVDHAGAFVIDAELHEIPKFVFRGPHSDTDPIHIGLFATLHGDEPEGALALATLLHRLSGNPEAALGIILSVYPICNPTGFEDGSRRSRRGADFDQEFWSFSVEPEVQILERELREHRFDGLITVRTAAGSGLTGHALDWEWGPALLETGLAAAARVLPMEEPLTGRPENTPDGVLSAPPERTGSLFEITLTAPQQASPHHQVFALTLAVDAILRDFRERWAARRQSAQAGHRFSWLYQGWQSIAHRQKHPAKQALPTAADRHRRLPSLLDF